MLFVNYVLGFELPLAACLAAIGASAWLNVALMAVFPSQHLSSTAETAAQLAFDIVQLSVLIGLTGGLQEPVPPDDPRARHGRRLAPPAGLCGPPVAAGADLLRRHGALGSRPAMAPGRGPCSCR